MFLKILSNLSEGEKINSELNMRGVESENFHKCYGIDKSMDVIEG
jgi:hypothetical protein